MVVLAVLVVCSERVGAELKQRDNVVVRLTGGVAPSKLPRDHAVPVSVHLAGGVRTTDRGPLPRVNRLKLELGWRGELLTHGLPTCPRNRIRGAPTSQALESCEGALVGRGKLNATIFVPGQPAFPVQAFLLAFNGRTKVGRRAVLVHAYTSRPPISFVIPFVVHRGKGSFHTILVTTLRRSVGTWPHVSNFRVNVARSFVVNGRRRGYLNAKCPLPSSFTAGFLSFARATYSFADGRQVKVEAVRSCRAR